MQLCVVHYETLINYTVCHTLASNQADGRTYSLAQKA